MRGEQLSRQWKLIQLLAKARYGVVADSLADELACNRRTVYRDLDALMFAGFPITSERRDGRVFYRVIDGFRLGDTPFTPDELLALGFSEDLLRVLEGTVFHDSIQSALAKNIPVVGDIELFAWAVGGENAGKVLAEGTRIFNLSDTSDPTLLEQSAKTQSTGCLHPP